MWVRPVRAIDAPLGAEHGHDSSDLLKSIVHTLLDDKIVHATIKPGLRNRVRNGQ